jgi:hypothetical protein
VPSGTQIADVPFGTAGNQIGGSSRASAADKPSTIVQCHAPFPTLRLQRSALVSTSPRDKDVPCAGISTDACCRDERGCAPGGQDGRTWRDAVHLSVLGRYQIES